ncbi:MAG: peptidylprolyl isomerase [Gemmatimonadetes bacterium]|nr:peptidylprolyl isomerase [Gemmatimonadota bacterium]
MRRLGAVFMVLALAGCDVLKDAFSARVEVVARAGSQTLSVERIAEWAGLSKQVPLTPEAFSRLAHVYVDYTLFAQQLAQGQTLDDSATTLSAMWPIASQMRWERFHDRLVAARAQLTAAQADSAYQAGEARLFQHILLQVPQSAAPPVIEQQRRLIEDLARQLQRGTRFGPLAARYSDDPGSKRQHGMLPVVERGAYVPAFEDAAWALPPGALSGVVRSPYGFHLIRRPPLAEVRDSFRVGLENRLAMRFDSIYADSLAQHRKLEVVDGAPAIVRQVMQDLDAARASGQTLVKYRGGSFRVRDMVRWVYSLDPSVAQALPGGTDEQIEQFLKVVAQRHLLLEQADSAKVNLAPEDWAYLKAQHDSALTILETLLNLSPQLFRDSAQPPAAREQLAAARVNDYLDRVVQSRAQFMPIPPLLAEVLRARADWSVSQAGLRRAVERAKEMRATADSLRVPPGQQGPPTLTPAPGPAPALDSVQGQGPRRR